MTEAEEKLIEALSQWVADYKDVAERNALAETPIESARYLLSLVNKAGYKSPEEVAELLAQARDGYIKLGKEPKIKAKIRKSMHYGLPPDASQRRM